MIENGKSFLRGRRNVILPGQYADVETGLNYNYQRDYDPSTGRYVESDPLGFAGGSYSTYAYSGGNPVSNDDYSGLFVATPPAVAPPPPVISTGARCLAAIAAAAPMIAAGVAAAAVPNPTSGCDTAYKPPSCGKDCTDITKEIYDAMNVVSSRISDLLIDKCNQYELARYAPNPSLPPGCNTTSWQGHITQAEGAQNRL